MLSIDVLWRCVVAINHEDTYLFDIALVLRKRCWIVTDTGGGSLTYYHSSPS
jgi:hypothetical protein